MNLRDSYCRLHYAEGIRSLRHIGHEEPRRLRELTIESGRTKPAAPPSGAEQAARRHDQRAAPSVPSGCTTKGGALAYALGTKAAGTLNVEFYTDIEETLPDPVVLEPLLGNTDAIAGLLTARGRRRGPGRTLALVMDLLAWHIHRAPGPPCCTPSSWTIIQPTTRGGPPACGSPSPGRRCHRFSWLTGRLSRPEPLPAGPGAVRKAPARCDLDGTLAFCVFQRSI